MSQVKFMSADEAAALIPDYATVAITGAGGGLLEPEELLAAIERRFLSAGSPRGLTLVHAQGLGDGKDRGLNHLAHQHLVKRVIGAHWSWSPRMQALAAAEKIEAYALPGGVIQHLVRDSGAGRPGLLTHIGLDTFVDPRREGGRMNAAARQPISELISLDGQDYIRYFPLKIDVAILRGSYADERGNVSFQEEGAELDGLVLATAAHNNGGCVLVQVRERVAAGELTARSARLPGALVDVVVVSPQQPQSYQGAFDAGLAGSAKRGDADRLAAETANVDWVRKIVGARAFEELSGGGIASFGFGMPDEVATVAARHGVQLWQTVDHGHYGGQSLQGPLFGFVRGGEALIDSPSQFDLYSGGAIDTAFLGFGEFDAQGDVNVSLLGGKIIGPGGFIDITQGSKKIVFCGAFEGRGSKVAAEGGRLQLLSAGALPKLVQQVQQVSFSGARAIRTGQEVLFVCERAVFRLTAEGVVLEEIAPGIDLQADVLDRMGFTPLLPPGGPRPITCFALL